MFLYLIMDGLENSENEKVKSLNQVFKSGIESSERLRG
jgi:hypothetical protein